MAMAGAKDTTTPTPAAVRARRQTARSTTTATQKRIGPRESEATSAHRHVAAAAIATPLCLRDRCAYTIAAASPPAAITPIPFTLSDSGNAMRVEWIPRSAANSSVPPWGIEVERGSENGRWFRVSRRKMFAATYTAGAKTAHSSRDSTVRGEPAIWTDLVTRYARAATMSHCVSGSCHDAKRPACTPRAIATAKRPR